MKKVVMGFGLALFCLLVVGTQVQAKDNWHNLSVQAAKDSALGQQKLQPGIKLYMKGQKHPKLLKRLGEYKTNKRTNGFGKSAEQACGRAFISALMALQNRANKEGGNAVIDIYTITKDKKFESATEYSCIKGAFVTNVALMGTVATLK